MDIETQANRPAAEPLRSFRDRTAQRLNAERDQAVERPPANPAADRYVEPDEPTTADLDEGAIDDDVEANLDPGEPSGDDEDDSGDPRIRELIQRVEEAEDARQSMERDYRRKTHRVAQAVEELRQYTVQASATHEVLLQEAQAGMAQFQGVDWQALQQDPARYQQAVAAYQQAQNMYQRRVAEAQQLVQRRQQFQEEARARQAEVSKDILRTQIPGWSGETYQSIKEFAVEHYDYTPEEVDQQVDWRWVKAMDDARRAVRRPGVKQVREQSKPPANSKNKPVAQGRDAKGRYQTARAAAFEKPGDRGAFRRSMQAKLRAEREG